MRDLSGEESLFALLPIAFVILGLVAGILFYSQMSGDTRSRASYPTVTPIPTVALPSTSPQSPSPAVACSQLYSPVCGIDGLTYSNRCEAETKGIAIATTGECTTAKTTPLPISPVISPTQ